MENKFREWLTQEDILAKLDACEILEPTGVQVEVLPAMIAGKDVLALAPTGTGKTLAYGLPILERVDTHSTEIQAVILCPTRELVMQVERELKRFARVGTKIISIYGGQSIEKQFVSIRRKPHVVVATTGRMLDHLRRKSIGISNVRTVVLDEADEMLNMGFRGDIEQILSEVTAEGRQTVMFSATMPKEISQIARDYQVDPVKVKVLADSRDIPDIDQTCYITDAKNKFDTLMTVLNTIEGQCLVFCNTKRIIEDLAGRLEQYGYNAVCLHGDLRQGQRTRIMKEFRGGLSKILVATDVAGRGIDIEGLDAVINYDLPFDIEVYTHRIGRTARAGKSGRAITLIKRSELKDIRLLEKLHNISIKVIDNKVKKGEMSMKKLQLALDKLKSGKGNETSIVTNELDEFNKANGTSYTFCQLCATLLEVVEDEYAPAKRESSEGGTFGSRGDKSARSRDDRPARGREDRPRQDRTREDKPREDRAREDRPRQEVTAGANLNNPTKLFVSVGQSCGANAEKLSGFFRNGGVDPKHIGEIKTMDNFSFVEIAAESEEKALALNGAEFGRGRIAIEKSKPMTERKSEGKRDYKPSSGGYGKPSGSSYGKPKSYGAKSGTKKWQFDMGTNPSSDYGKKNYKNNPKQDVDYNVTHAADAAKPNTKGKWAKDNSKGKRLNQPK